MNHEDCTKKDHASRHEAESDFRDRKLGMMGERSRKHVLE
jgi:hypothetical protein